MRILKVVVSVLVLLLGARLLGLTPARVMADGRSLLRGDYMEQTKERLRAEAAKMPAAADDGQPKDELREELQAERRRIMEEKAATLEKYGSEIVKGDVESLKRQVEENARRAGGNQ